MEYKREEVVYLEVLKKVRTFPNYSSWLYLNKKSITSSHSHFFVLFSPDQQTASLPIGRLDDFPKGLWPGREHGQREGRRQVASISRADDQGEDEPRAEDHTPSKGPGEALIEVLS